MDRKAQNKPITCSQSQYKSNHIKGTKRQQMDDEYKLCLEEIAWYKKEIAEIESTKRGYELYTEEELANIKSALLESIHFETSYLFSITQDVETDTEEE
jgi:hypothetical protein